MFLWRWFVLLVKFSYWYKFHVRIITGSGVRAIVVYKGLTINREIRKAWISQSASVTAFTFSELLRENEQGVNIRDYG